jgi:hypothetical protein
MPRPPGELHPQLRSRVRAAAGQAADVEVVPEGAGYRISAVSGDTAPETYPVPHQVTFAALKWHEVQDGLGWGYARRYSGGSR